MAKLLLKNNELLLEREGRCFPVSADHIYSSVIERHQVWSDVKTGREGVAEELDFSRYPLVPLIVIDQKNKHSFPTLEIWLCRGALELFRGDMEMIQKDQIIFDNIWYPLDVDACVDIGHVLKRYSVSAGVFTSLKSYLALKAFALENSLVLDRNMDESISPMSLIPSRKYRPKGVVGELYPYQIDGWNWLRLIISEGIGGLLADEMGLGKTLQIISAISDSGKSDLGKILVIAPGSLLENWRREFKKFSPSIECIKHHGPWRTGEPAVLLQTDVVITTYELIVRDNSLFNMINWGLVVLDEAQNIKNPDAKRTLAVKKLRRDVGVAVTGTPLENSLLDIWSIFDFFAPGYLGSKKEFESRYRNDVENGRELEPLISPLLLRRKVSAVATDLPSRIEIPQALELDQGEAEAYERIREKIYREYGRVAALVSLAKLRMFCSHPCLLDEEEASSFVGAGVFDFSKIRRLDEILEEIFAVGQKVLIFSTYTKSSDLIVNHVKSKFGVASMCLDGRTPIDDRQALIDKFSNYSGPASLVLNPRAGGTGLNITAANHVIHYNLEWNPALEDQASARSYRRGQLLPVTIHRFFYVNTVEEVINQRVERKRDIYDASIVGSEGTEKDYEDIIKAIQISPVNVNRKD